LTFSSSATRGIKGSRRPASPGTWRRALARGWRTRTLAWVRTCRPSETIVRTADIASSRAGSTKPGSAVGKSVRWTDSGAAGSPSATRFLYISSVTNGTNGASIPHRAARHSWSVA
jgi:hypothetical protein